MISSRWRYVVRLDDAVALNKALGDPSRVRICAALQARELSVSELCEVLQQSQPRISRHLRVLTEAELVVRQAEGTRAFFRMTDDPARRAAVDSTLALLDPADPTVTNDRERLAGIAHERERRAEDYFARIAAEWDHIRSRHVDDRLVEAAVAEALPRRPRQELIDLGTGTGRMLELLADRVTTGVGVDTSRQMLHLARTRIERHRLAHLRVREGSILALDLDPGSFDAAVMHHVLHFLDEPSAAIREAARVLRADGALIVVDFAPHDLQELRRDHAHRRLGVSESEMTSWCAAAGLSVDLVHHLRGPEADQLTVTLWRARKTSYADVAELEVA